MEIKNQVFSVLPIKYRTFDAMLNNNAVNLYWITDDAGINDHFEIERSFDRNTFSTVGMVLGAQPNIGMSGHYNFKDAGSELQGHTVIYYRLKQVDENEKASYSAVKVVRNNSISKAFVQ